nr:hypothetical protein [Tanacetum cinerariifolium]
MMSCHPPIRPAATYTIPRIQLLAASRRHVAASYWTAASDVAATSAPVNAVDHRSTTAFYDGDRRSTTVVNVADHRSTPADHGGDRWSTVAVNDGRRWRTTVYCRWTTVDHHQTTGQRWLVGWSTSGSGLGSGRFWAGSATWHATCQPRVPTWQLTWILSTRWESNLVPLGKILRQNQENHCARQWT